MGGTGSPWYDLPGTTEDGTSGLGGQEYTAAKQIKGTVTRSGC